MFEKYRLYKYQSSWGISRRFLLLFRRKMTHLKVVRHDAGPMCSRELILFSDIICAMSELSWMKSTGMELKRKVYKDGVLIEINRYSSRKKADGDIIRGPGDPSDMKHCQN